VHENGQYPQRQQAVNVNEHGETKGTVQPVCYFHPVVERQTRNPRADDIAYNPMKRWRTKRSSQNRIIAAMANNRLTGI